MSTTEMKAYYARRAAEYEKIYARPERQADLSRLIAAIEEASRGRDVLDVACGTGYFTAHAARHARSVTGIDANEETLAIARAKGLPNAQYLLADAYAIPLPPRSYDGALVTFWWSHIPLARIDEFMRGLHRHLAPGAAVLIADNTYVDGNSTPISRRDGAGNTYQIRTLENGERYEVLKNFPTRDELGAWGTQFGEAVSVHVLTYYWLLEYRVR